MEEAKERRLEHGGQGAWMNFRELTMRLVCLASHCRLLKSAQARLRQLARGEIYKDIEYYR